MKPPRIVQLSRAVYLGPINSSIPAVIEINGVRFISLTPSALYEQFQINELINAICESLGGRALK